MNDTKMEGRYDILKTLERAWQDRGHKGPMEAKLGHVADQYRKDMEAVKVLLDFAKIALKDIGGCDHAVGVCCCEAVAAVERVERIFPLPTDTIWEG